MLDYLQRIKLFNSRHENPTAWEIELHTGADFFERMLRERPGNVVIMSGRNRPKIDRVAASVEGSLNMLLTSGGLSDPPTCPGSNARSTTPRRSAWWRMTS